MKDFFDVLVLIGVIFAIAATCRDILCWIFRIDDRIKKLDSLCSNLESISKKLDAIDTELASISKRLVSKDPLNHEGECEHTDE